MAMKMGMARPTDRSVETFKATVEAFMKQMGVDPRLPENKLTEDEWKAACEQFWRAADAAAKGEPKPEAKLSALDSMQTRLDSLRRHGYDR